MKEIVYISANREGYGIDQVRHTMTVGELIAYLEQFDEDDAGETDDGIEASGPEAFSQAASSTSHEE